MLGGRTNRKIANPRVSIGSAIPPTEQAVCLKDVLASWHSREGTDNRGSLAAAAHAHIRLPLGGEEIRAQGAQASPPLGLVQSHTLCRCHRITRYH